MQRLGDGLRVAGYFHEVGAGAGVRFRDTLFPIPQPAERDTEARGELFLRETERAADDFRTRNTPHSIEVLRHKGLRVRDRRVQRP
jgi:hypothetical protein